MKCKQIKQLLPDYIDNNLDKVVKKDIKSHISSCESCSKELKLFKKYNKELANLPKATAPNNFLNEIHEKLEEPPPFDKIKNFLLVPLKIPKEALGVAILAIVAIIYFNPVEQLEQAFKPAKDIMTPEEIAFDTDIEAMKKEEKKPPVNKKYRKSRYKKSIAKKIKRKEAPTELADERKEEKTYIIVLSLDRAPGGRTDKPKIDSKALKKKGDSERDIIVIENRAAETKNTTLQLVADDEEAKLKRKIKRVKQAALSNKAKIIKEDVAMSNKTGKYIILEVPASEYNNLVNSLNNIGSVKKKTDPPKINKAKSLKL